jgi:AhpD family alkylhydroperoxidase
MVCSGGLSQISMLNRHVASATDMMEPTMAENPTTRLQAQPIMTLALTVLAAGLLLNGVAMISFPGWWHAAVPGVAETGPLNAHFVRDLGAAAIAAALSVGSALMLPRPRSLIALLLLPAAVFLGLHALFHVAELVAHGGGEPRALVAEALGVFLPAALVGSALSRFRTAAMPRRVFAAALKAGERKVGVSLDYMREIARNAPAVLPKLVMVSDLARSHESVPAEIALAAAIGAVRCDDCGECLQIHVNFARRDGISPEIIAELLADRPDALPPALADAYRYGRAIAANDPVMEDWRMALEGRLGRGPVVQLAFYVAVARFFPSFKRGTGYAKSCGLIRLDLKQAA